VIAFSYGGRLTAPALETALAAILPRDLAVRDLREVTPAFNPRYAARYREYRYTVWNGPHSPLRERTALGVRDSLDTAAMARAGSAFIGRHDFRAFGVADRTTVRTVISVRVRRSGRVVTIDVRADSFLRGQVRRMVGLLLEVGLGSATIDDIRAALADPTMARKGAAAPAKGLCLRHVAIERRIGSRTTTNDGEIEER
jgi:tRNA pseudouridine38-40 synthase